MLLGRQPYPFLVFNTTLPVGYLSPTFTGQKNSLTYLFVLAPMKPYTPISCSFYSRLEGLTLKQVPVPLVYFEEGALKSLVSVVIDDVFMHEKVEYLRLSDGAIIRLDRLVSVNGIPLRRHC